MKQNTMVERDVGITNHKPFISKHRKRCQVVSTR